MREVEIGKFQWRFHVSKTALIIDDSALARHVLSQLLGVHGVMVETEPSAEMALEHLRHDRPDVVFMEHMMSGMDGFEALEAIKANPATATIVAVAIRNCGLVFV